ncbi:MAG: 16S rRNA (cytosine(1402)-N(4))-methyltransferase RsmH [Bacteroidales bacterium]|nr:16S rRNA (cytosine(1402)-N(4))-methyltransferase RsmH [Bacteroidales bacterium]MDD3988758.1 16S rRNA (cytosine(1402)-N(4))-methyltransferase RsmH [Bacteroidales bacterium]
MSSYHTPVLLHESVSALAVKEQGIYIDATMGGGGHTREILSRMGKSGRLLAFDQDESALRNAPEDSRLTVVHSNFRFIGNFMRLHGISFADGIIADLGVSSHQFDTMERGFSFRFDSELDMRMNRNAAVKASDVINEYPRERLEWILINLGEVENGKRAASLICSAREKGRIMSTADLNRVLSPVIPGQGEHKYLARIYQALRIEVNGEMRALEGFLNSIPDILRSQGRVAVITYHSLEDRMVKNFFRSGNIYGERVKNLYGVEIVPFKLITKKPVTPAEAEIASNTRARSAKLRVAEKI